MYSLGVIVAGIGLVIGCLFAAAIISTFLGSLAPKNRTNITVGLFFVSLISLMLWVGR